MVEIRIAELRTSKKSASYGGTGANEWATFIIKNIQSLNISLRTPISPMPLPEEGADENVLVKVEGNTKTIRVSFIIHERDDFNTDAGATCWTYNKLSKNDATGTLARNVWYSKNVQQQIKFLSNVLEAKGMMFHHKLQVCYSGDTTVTAFAEDLVYFGFITNINIDIQGQSPATAQCTIDFIVGDTITGLDDDIPSVPKSVSVAPTSSAKELTVGWSAPDDFGGATTSASNLKYYLQYSQVGAESDVSDELEVSAGTTSYTLTSSNAKLESGTRYNVRVRAVDEANKKGDWSFWVQASGDTV